MSRKVGGLNERKAACRQGLGGAVLTFETQERMQVGPNSFCVGAYYIGKYIGGVSLWVGRCGSIDATPLPARLFT